MTVHAHPRAILEVRRILLEHLAQVRETSPAPWSPDQRRPLSNDPRRTAAAEMTKHEIPKHEGMTNSE